LVFGHLFSGVRFLHDSQRKMPVEGQASFGALKKAYAKGIELKGKTLGIIGYGRIGHELAKMGLGLGMNVLVCDTYSVNTEVKLTFFDGQSINLSVKQVQFDQLLENADFISLHVPFLGEPLIGSGEIAKMKDGVGIVNASRGGIIDEKTLIDGLDSGK